MRVLHVEIVLKTKQPEAETSLVYDVFIRVIKKESASWTSDERKRNGINVWSMWSVKKFYGLFVDAWNKGITSFRKSVFKVRSAASVLKLCVFRKLNHFHLRDPVSYSLGSVKQCWVWLKGVFLQKLGGDTSLLGCFSPSRFSPSHHTWWLFPNPPLIAYPSKWYIIKSYPFFSLFFELIYFPIVNSAVSWCGNIDYFTDSGTLHHHNIGSWQTLSLYHNHNIQSPSGRQCRRTSGGRDLLVYVRIVETTISDFMTEKD